MADNVFLVRTASQDKFVQAKFLTDAAGKYITSTSIDRFDANIFSRNQAYLGGNTEGYIVVPANFNIGTVIEFGRDIKQIYQSPQSSAGLSIGVLVDANLVFTDAFRPNGWMDVQTHYNGTEGENVPALRATAVYG